MTEKISVRIPIALTGEPAGVTQEGGILEHLLRELEIECLPVDLVEEIEIDVSGLGIGDSVQVSDLKVDGSLTVLTPADIAVASVLAPRVEEEPVPEEAEVPEGAEPEVIGEAEKEKEESEEKEGKGAKGAGT